MSGSSHGDGPPLGFTLVIGHHVSVDPIAVEVGVLGCSNSLSFGQEESYTWG